MNSLQERQQDRHLEISRTPAATQPVEWGINIDAPGPQKNHFEVASQAKFGWVRLWFWWNWLEGDQGQINWPVMDAQIAWAKKKGFKVMVTLLGQPSWFNNTPKNCNFWVDFTCSRAPSNSAAWGQFVGAVAKRYRQDVAAWAIWNEPNNKQFWSGTLEQYLTLILEPASLAIRANAPESIIAGPELAHFSDSDNNWINWLKESLKRKNGKLFDVVSHHRYPKDLKALKNLLADMAAVINQAGFQKKIWITELGYSSCGLGNQGQADKYKEVINYAKSSEVAPNLEKIFAFDIADYAGDTQGCKGISSPDPQNNLKPAAVLFSQSFQAPTPAPSYSSQDPAFIKNELKKLKALADQSFGGDAKYNFHQWNYFYTQLTKQRSPGFDLVTQMGLVYDQSKATDLATWWQLVKDTVRFPSQ